MNENNPTAEQMKRVHEAFELVGLGDMAEYKAGFIDGYRAGQKETLQRALVIFEEVSKRRY